jgi:hypothetical protein
MKRYKASQLKALSDFANMLAAAWFTAGIISPFFTKPISLLESTAFAALGILMTTITLRWSLSLLKGVDT